MPARPPAALDKNRLPLHIGIIMDGNGRWARRRGHKRTFGHRVGARAVRRVVRACRRLGVKCLTLYAFSSENWGRPREEVDVLMNLLVEFIGREWAEIMRRDIRVRAIGDLRRLPPQVRRRLQELVIASRRNRSMTLALAVSYGARDEIVRAVRRLGRRLPPRTLGRLDESSLAACLDTAGLPDPDLIIRTGGQKRLSNFLLWQAAYAELYFTTRLWPDFTEEDLYRALLDYQRRRRRFGLTDEQLRGKSP